MLTRSSPLRVGRYWLLVVVICQYCGSLYVSEVILAEPLSHPVKKRIKN